MNIIVKNLFSAFVLAVALISCKKEGFNGLSDIRPAVPVTVTNAIDYRPEPTVATSISGGGSIQIILSIPATSGRTIKEITRIALGTSFTKIQGTAGLFNSAPIPVNSTTWTFNTSLTEYTAKGGGAIPGAGLNTANGQISTTGATETSQRFYFLITLDDGTQIIPEPVRILVRS
jgi:hypothetical protein